MGEQSIIHGRINLKGDFKKSRNFIQSLKEDNKFPWIKKEMFSQGTINRPYYYDEPVIGFAASYKGVENYWAALILKFENILRNIEFENAKLQLETEFLGTYYFFWDSKKERKEEILEKKKKYIETSEWNFGFGNRDRWGYLNEDLDELLYSKMNFNYPIQLNQDLREKLNKIIKHIDKDKVVFINDRIEYSDELYPVLIEKDLKGKIDFGYDQDKGYWIELKSKK